MTFNDEAEQYLLFALLRPGTSPAKLGLRGRLRTLFRKLRAAFPGVRLRVRLDGGFAGEDVLSFLEAEGVEYVVAIGGQSPPGQTAPGASWAGRGCCPRPAARPSICSGRRATRPRSGGASGGSSSRPKWCGIRAGPPRTIPGSW